MKCIIKNKTLITIITIYRAVFKYRAMKKLADITLLMSASFF